MAAMVVDYEEGGGIGKEGGRCINCMNEVFEAMHHSLEFPL